MSQKVPWSRVLIEGAVIVGSILLAFAIDAAWDQRQEDARTDRQVSALIQELAQTKSELMTRAQGAESSSEGSAAILELMRGSDRAVTPAELAEHVMKSFNVGIFTPQHPVLTMLLSSGELMDLDDGSLLPLLGQWQDDLEHLRLDSQHLERNREETIFDRAVTIGVPIEPRSPAPSLVAILDDRGMEAAFATRLGRARRLTASYTSSIQVAEEIIETLERAVGPAPR